MAFVLMFTGVIIGVLLSVGCAILYHHIQDERDAQERVRRLEKQYRDSMKRKMNEPREPLSQAIMEQTRKELQERDES